MSKTRTFVLTKSKYSKEEVIDMLSEVIEEAKQEGFDQYDEVYVNHNDYSDSDEYSLTYSTKVPHKITTKVTIVGDVEITTIRDNELPSVFGMSTRIY